LILSLKQGDREACRNRSLAGCDEEPRFIRCRGLLKTRKFPDPLLEAPLTSTALGSKK
jgi:hypothetical protein